MTTTAADLVTVARAGIDEVSVDQLAAELDRGDTVLVDLREPEELAETGRIPGSVHIPRGMLEFRADPTSPYHNDVLHPSRRVVLHCASGARSALGARALQELGYERVAHLDGGIKAWIEAGRPVEDRERSNTAGGGAS